MTVRYAAVLSVPSPHRPSPPGADPGEFRLALLEDTYEVVAGLELVKPALVLSPPHQPDAEAITWPGTLIVREDTLPGAFAALHAAGAEEAALLAPDAPDLPPLLLGKLFRALGSAPSAACQSEGGGLVALAARLPLPDWLATALKDTDLDVPDALARLRAAAPRPGQIPQGPSWHRLRAPEDLRLLDPGLEGWETTRALLEGHPLS
ncbi:hypothetical protein ACGFNU_43155 [Spirillospora sp. NPDC048911]|uniref:hypothetical protein n=1 Tax=Spirillospora sp. NPDC048911 TaxID=3364527 RepID=UPI003721C2B4